MDISDMIRWFDGREGITTGIFTVTGTLGGVWLTQRYAARIAREQRRDAHQAAVRGILTRLITTGRAWAYMAEPMAVQLAGCKNEEVSETLDSIWQSTEWAEVDRLARELLDAFTAAELHVADRSITDSLGYARLWIGTVDSALRDRSAPDGGEPSRNASERYELQEIVSYFRYWLRQTEYKARFALRMSAASFPRRARYAIRSYSDRVRDFISRLRPSSRPGKPFYVDPLRRFPKA